MVEDAQRSTVGCDTNPATPETVTVIAAMAASGPQPEMCGPATSRTTAAPVSRPTLVATMPAVVMTAKRQMRGLTGSV